jgi:peroxiredoxin
MTLKIRFTLLIFTFSSLYCIANPKSLQTARSVLIKIRHEYEKHTSISYNISYKMKFFSDDDTTKISGQCKLIRRVKDPLFRGEFWYHTNDSLDGFYNLQNTYLIDHREQKIIQSTEKKLISRHTTGDLIDVYFLFPKELTDEVNDPKVHTSLLENKEYFIVVFKYADFDGFTKGERKLWIRKKDYVIDKVTFCIKFQGHYQYNEWNLKNIEFDKVSSADLGSEVDYALKSYAYKKQTNEPEETFKPLAIGTAAPDFSAMSFQDDKLFSLNNQKGKIIVMDFFYMSCMPCIKAIPELVKLKENYGDRGVMVIGINSVDTGKNKTDRLAEFIRLNHINYPIILPHSKTDSLYNISSYPTLYIISSEGNIVFSGTGYSKNFYSTLASVIDAEIRKRRD